jgi:hypothetical protein
VATVAGLGVIAAGVARFETADQDLIAKDTMAMELAGGEAFQPQISDYTSALSDRGARIELGIAAGRDGNAHRDAEEKFLRSSSFTAGLIRRSPADDRANCHGWVFAAGRYHVAGRTVNQIIRDNGYEQVQAPRPGDLVVYRNGANVVHTAVVRYVTDGMPVLVEGKWGTIGVFLHVVDKSCYGTEYTYYRSPRPGHQLAGMISDAAPRIVAGG